jgi:nucleotide-binding universal stress UspA family protein
MVETIGVPPVSGWRKDKEMFDRILLAIDDSPSAPAAVSFAIAMASSSHAMVHVVHVNEFVVGGRGQTVETRNEADQVVTQAVAELKAAGMEATGVVSLANCFTVADHIVETADEFSADVIVVGSRRRSRWGSLRGMGVHEQITKLTSLPVMTAPPPLELERERRVARDKLVSADSPECASLSPWSVHQRSRRRFRTLTSITGRTSSTSDRRSA